MAEEQILSAEEEFDQAFSEADAGSTATETPDGGDDDGQGGAETGDGKEAKGSEGEGETTGGEGESGSEEGGKEKGAEEDLFKAERERYEARIRELEGKVKPASEEKKPEPTAEELPKEVKEVFEDYPELQMAVEKIVEMRVTAAVNSVTGQLGGQLAYEREIANGFYDAEAKAYVEGVPDAYRILNMPEFEAWAKADPEAAKLLQSPHTAKQAIPVLRRFKESLAKQAAGKHDKEQAQRSQRAREEAAGSTTPVTRKGSGGKGKEPDPDDFDEAWREAD